MSFFSLDRLCRWFPTSRAVPSPVCPAGRAVLRPVWLLSAALLVSAGCRTTEDGIDETQVDRYEERMEAEAPIEPAPDLTQLDRQPPVDLVGQVKAADMALDETVWLHLPDPSMAPEVLEKRLEITRYGERMIRREYEEIYRNIGKYIQEIEREQQFRLTLADALHRVLTHSYQIQVEGYAPAISTAQIVQAEAAFDVAFFANISRNNTDQPTPSQLLASASSR